MKFECIKEVEEFINRFEQGNLSISEWTHDAHFVVALWYLLRDTPAHALKKIRFNIMKNNESLGIANTFNSGYHETITRFYVWAILGYIVRRNIEEVEINYFNDILEDPISDKGYPLNFYSRERLFSLSARKEWLEPDLQMML